MTGSEEPVPFRPLIFAVSCSCLVFELSLLRIFSITLWYHFAFMVISTAMLGIGASGTALAVLPSLKAPRRMPLYALLFALSLPLSYAAVNAVPFDPARLAWDGSQVLMLGACYVILAVPFFLFGAVLSTAYASLPERSPAVYASDLLGAGTGSLAVLLLLSLGGPQIAVLLASLLSLLILALAGRGRFRVLAFALFPVVLALLFLRPAFLEPRMSPYKPLSVALSFPGSGLTGTYFSPYARIDTFRSPAVRFAPGLSLLYRGALPRQNGIAVDGGSIDAVTDGSDPSSLRFLDHLPTALPYRLAAPDRVLVLDPGGGLDVLTARRNGARSIDAIESNPLLLEVVGKQDPALADRARYHAGLGRMWLSGSDASFDIIDIPLSGVMGSSAFGFFEDHRYTVEAFRLYLSRLAPGGLLSITHYIHPPPRTELRTLATLAAAARKIGIADITDLVIAMRSWGTVTILFSRTPLSPEAIEAARRFCRENRFDVVYYPGMGPGEGNRYVRMQDDSYADAFRRVIDRRSREAFLASYLFDVRPVRDANPFPRYFLRLENVGQIFGVMGEKWQFFFEEGYLLPLLFLQAAVIVSILLAAPFARPGRKKASPEKHTVRGWPWYFACLGLGYLFVEVAVIQTMGLTLEHPAYAAGTVIAALLIGSGAGGLSLQYVPSLRSPLTLVVLGAATFLYTVVLAPLSVLLGPVPLQLRAAAVFLLLLPAGFLMGIPFPLGMGLLGMRHRERVPWAWAVNGCFSVFAPILAVMLALKTGYRVVGGLGSLLYVAGYLVMRRWPHGEER